MITKPSEDAILITIGMIVKNEEDVLRRCLNSVRKLMQRLPCELIITDTGSTDDTVEIAKEYTDKITYFKWCDDFAAARNEALDISRGKWFMFLDADEVITEELLDEMVEFFNSGEYKGFKTVAINLRNYTSLRLGSEYISRGGRLFDTGYGRRFYSPIHELVDSLLPMKSFKNVIAHYGYNVDDVKRMKNKENRNLPLMQKYVQEHPNDLHMLYQLGVGSSGDESLKMLLRAKEIVGKKVTGYLGAEVYAALMQRYFATIKYEKSLDTYNEYMKNRGGGEETFSELDLYFFVSQCYSKLQRIDEAAEMAQKYFTLYERFRNSTVQNETNMMMRVSDECANEMLTMYANSFAINKDYDRANTEYLKAYFETDKTNAPDIVTIVIGLTAQTNDATWLPLLYEQVLKMSNKTLRKENVRKIARALCYSDFAFNARSMFRSKFPDAPITWALNAFYLGLDEEDLPKAIEMMPLCKKEGCDMLLPCAALRGEVALEPLLQGYSGEEICALTNAYDGMQDKASLFLYDFAFGRALTESKRAQFYIISALELLCGSLDCDSEKLRFSYADTLLALYRTTARKIYSEDALNGDFEFVMPDKYRFALMTQGKTGIEEVKAIKEAVIKCESMFYLADIMVDQIETNIKKEKSREAARKEEWELLATNIKAEILGFINDGRMEDAANVLNSYEKIAPDDQEIKILREKMLLAQEPQSNLPS